MQIHAACLATCLLLAAFVPAFAQSLDPCKAGSPAISAGQPSRQLELLFNVTHNYGNPAQEPVNDQGMKTRLHLELVDKCYGTDAHYVTCIIRIADAGQKGGNPILVDVFQTESGMLNLDIVSYQNKTGVYAKRDPFLGAALAEKPDYAIAIRNHAIKQNGSYEMNVQLLTIDNVRNLFAPSSEPETTLSWNHQDRSIKVSMVLKTQAPAQPALPMEPVTLKTDRQSYESGDTVRVSGNVGIGIAKALKGNAGVAGGLRFGVTGSSPHQEFVLMDNISNVTSSGDFAYSFQMKGIGTMHSGPFAVQVWSPDGNSASTLYNFTYSAQKAVASNPMTIDWSGAKSVSVSVFDMRYGADPADSSVQKYERAFSREMRYRVVPEGAATVDNITATHLKGEGRDEPIPKA